MAGLDLACRKGAERPRKKRDVPAEGSGDTWIYIYRL